MVAVLMDMPVAMDNIKLYGGMVLSTTCYLRLHDQIIMFQQNSFTSYISYSFYVFIQVWLPLKP